MATLTLQGTGVADTHLDSDEANTAKAALTVLNMGQAGDIGRPLLKFDFSSIPAGSTITSAVLTLTYNGVDYSSNARVVSIYRVLQTSVVAQATWNSFSTGNTWDTAGCGNTTTDRESTDIGDGPTQSATPSDGGTVVITLTNSKVQDMITGGSITNNGFLLKVATENTDQVQYYSTNDATEATRPKLVIEYTPAVAGDDTIGYFLF